MDDEDDCYDWGSCIVYDLVVAFLAGFFSAFLLFIFLIVRYYFFGAS